MAYTYQPQPAAYNFAEAVQRIAAPKKVIGHPDTSDGAYAQIIAGLSASGIAPQAIQIDCSKYAQYVSEAGYPPEYYAANFAEKSLEHFLALGALEMDRDSVFADIAAEHSPLSDIATRLYGCHGYTQDIMFEPGIHGNRIGCDACTLPVENGFFTHACLTCSIEHFEGDADTRLFQELARVIRPGGRVVIIPLYLSTTPAVLTDPRWALSGGVRFDPEATIYCLDGWANRHGRFYSAESLRRRIIDPTPGFRFSVYRLLNRDQIDPSVYARWMLLAERI